MLRSYLIFMLDCRRGTRGWKAAQAGRLCQEASRTVAADVQAVARIVRSAVQTIVPCLQSPAEEIQGHQRCNQCIGHVTMHTGGL